MTVLTLLQAVGKDVNKGIILMLPYSQTATAILTIFFPELGPLIGVVFVAVATAENHYQFQQKSGPQKLAYAMQIAEPAIKKYVPEGTSVEMVVQGVVDLLNKHDEKGALITNG